MLNSLQEQLSLIEDINNSCRLFFSESTFFLRPSKTNRFMLTGSYSSSAINNHGNTSEEINVIKWFDDLWIYIEIKFEKNRNNEKCKDNKNQKCCTRKTKCLNMKKIKKFLW